MILLLMLAQVVAPDGAMAGFPGAVPGAEERLALPHIADAQAAASPAAAVASLERAMALLPQPTRFRGAVQCFRGVTLMRADASANKAAGTGAIDECLRLNPDAPLAQRIGADAAFARGDFRGGAVLLARAVTREPRLAQGMQADQIDTIFRQLGYLKADAEQRALVAALIRTDIAADDPARASGWSRDALLQALERGDTAAGAGLLPYVVDPADGLQMLVDRRYATLWPRIDEWAAGTLEAQRAALASAARASVAIAPTLARARNAANVLARTGTAEEGRALLAKAVADFGPPRDDYDYARAVVRLAALTADAGERESAKITAPLLAALAGGVTGPMLINVVPNLAMFQIALGDPAAALATLDRYATAPDRLEARAAFGYFVALRGCAEAKRGQAAAAATALATMRRDYRANTGALSIATACIGSDADVVADWTAQVDDPASRGGALLAMLRARAQLDDDPLSLTDTRLRTIAMRPEVSARLERYGRPLPDSYRPALAGWRQR